MYVFNQTQQYFIIKLIGNKFQSLGHHYIKFKIAHK